MVSKQTIEFKIGAEIQWYIREYDDCWVAKCEPLKLVAEADTIDELKEIIAETLATLFEDLIRDGDLEDFLQEVGWTKMTTLPKIKREDLEHGMQLRVPFEAFKESKGGRYVRA